MKFFAIATNIGNFSKFGFIFIFACEILIRFFLVPFINTMRYLAMIFIRLFAFIVNIHKWAKD